MNPVEPDPEITGSHEESWIFSQVSQWGSNWPYTNDHLNTVRSYVITTRALGLKNHYPAREVHLAQLFLWRYYIQEPDTAKHSYKDIIPLAYENAAQMSIDNQRQPSHREQVMQQLYKSEVPHQADSGMKAHFDMISKLNYNMKINHPSDFLKEFITPEFTDRQLELAECIISDSFLCPCCILHQPRVIAEGAAIMAAGMTGSPQTVIPRTVLALSFIKDMKRFYQQSLTRLRDPQNDSSKV